MLTRGGGGRKYRLPPNTTFADLWKLACRRGSGRLLTPASRGLRLAVTSSTVSCFGDEPMSDPAKGAAQWLAGARGGSPEALGRVLEACRGYLLLVAERELAPDLRAKGGASDLVQETFLEAQRDFADFRGDTEAEFRAWLRRLLLHNVANFARHFRDTAQRQAARERPLPAETP